MIWRRLSFTETIIVLVGEAKTAFSVHKDVIASRSTYFEGACSGRRISRDGEADSLKHVDLSNVDEQVFDIYLHCIYKDFVDIGDVEYVLTGKDELSNVETKYARLVKLWILADRLGDIVTSNMVIDQVISHAESTSKIPGAPSIRAVESGTVTKSTPRKLFIDFYIHNEDRYAILSLLDLVKAGDVPHSFLRGVIEKKARLESENRHDSVDDLFMFNYSDGGRCQYRQHNDALPTCGEACELDEARWKKKRPKRARRASWETSSTDEVLGESQ